MKKLVIFSVFCGFLAVFWGGFFAPQASAIPGDVSGNDTLDIRDVTYLVNYLFMGGPPPPNPIDADIDGSPGINMGDVLQLTGYLFMGCSLLPYTGVSVRVGSEIRFSADPIFSGAPGTKDTSHVRIIVNGGPSLRGMVIPLSYHNQPNETEVTLNSVSFTGSIIPSSWLTGKVINPDSETVLIYAYADQPSDPPLTSGTTGIVANLYFTRVDSANAFAISTKEILPSNSFILIKSYCADTVHNSGNSPSERIFTPMLSLSLNGDVNCDEIVDLGDLVYLITYLYKAGAIPCGM